MAPPSSSAGPRVLGIDPGTRVVGYALVEARGRAAFRYLECGVIRPRAADLADRILEIAADMEEVIDAFEPAELAIERAFAGKNAQSALKLGQARGALVLAARRRGLSVFEYAPAAVKRAVAGHGRAPKRAMQERVAFLCGLASLPPADAADALALAICHVFGRGAA